MVQQQQGVGESGGRGGPGWVEMAIGVARKLIVMTWAGFKSRLRGQVGVITGLQALRFGLGLGE